MLRAQYIISIVVNVTDIRVLNFIIQFVSNVFNPSNIHVVGFQQSWICPYHSLSKNLHVNIWFLPYKFNTSLYNNCHSSRQPLFIVNPHFLPTRNIPLEQKSQSQSTSQQPEPGPLWGPPELGPGDEDGAFSSLPSSSYESPGNEVEPELIVPSNQILHSDQKTL
jgi:hypothetical protein